MICKPPANISSSSQIVDGSVALASLAAGARPEQNLLCNPGFNFAQLQTPGTLTTISDNSYGADCWKMTQQNAGMQYQRVSNSGVSGWISANRGRFKKITNAGRMVIFQGIENLVTLGLLNQTVNFQINIQFSTARAFRLAFLNFSGTADAMTAPISDFTTSPMSLNANWAYIGTTLISAASAGTSIGTWNVSFTMPGSGISNLVVAIMIEDSMAINETFDVGECHLNIGGAVRTAWYPLSAAEDQARVERFYEKSYDIDTPSATNTLVGSVQTMQVGTTSVTPIRYRQRKPKTPTVTLLTPAGTTANWRDTTGPGANVAVTSQNIGLSGCGVKVTAGTDSNELTGHYTLDSQL